MRRGADQIKETLEAVYKLKIQTVWLWPNIDAGSDDISKVLRTFREQNNPELIHFYINFPVEDYGILLNNCSCIVGNSSSGLREGSFLGIPSVNIGSRQFNRERGKNVIDVNYNSGQIRIAIKDQLIIGRFHSDDLFGNGTASSQIVKILSFHDAKIQKVFHDRR